MKKLNLVRAASLLACGATLSAASLPSVYAQSNPSAPPEIVVTASRSEQDLQTTPVGATIITRAQIESSGVLDANEAIRKIGGVIARSDQYGGRDYTLDLRGFGTTANENTVVLVDGIRISENEMSLPARLSGIAAGTIERIEILRGGSGVMWGEGASAGVINILTRKDAKAGLTGQVGASAESYGGKEAIANLRLGLQSGKDVLDLSARSFSSNGYRDNTQSSQDVVSAGYAYADGGLSFRARLNHDVSRAGLPGSLTLSQLQTNPRQTATPSDWYGYQTTKLNAGTEYRVSDWTFLLDGGVKVRRASYQYLSQGATSPTLTDVRTSQLSPRAVYRGAMGSSTLIATTGMDIYKWQYTNDGAFDTTGARTTRTGDQSSRALYTMLDFLLPTQTRLVAGYRLDNIFKTSQNATTAPLRMNVNNQLHASELSLNQTVRQDLDFYARVATSYRSANIDEYNAWLNNSPVLPQTSIDREFGVKQRSGSTVIAGKYFIQNTTNEIAQDPSGFANWNFVDPTKRSGIELQASAALSPMVTLSGNVQSIKAQFSGGVYAGKQIPLVSNNTASARASYKLTAEQSIETTVRYTSAQYFGYDYANTCSKQIPAARMLDALYRYQIKTYEVSFGVNNLTNIQTYSAINCGMEWESYYPDPSRTVRAALKYNF